MIHIPPLRTRRISARLKEVTAGAAIRLAAIHPRMYEYAATEFLRAVIEVAETPTAKHVADPRFWTVQERTLAVCHYLAAAAPGGNADFEVGDSGRLTHYMDTGADYVDSVSVGQVGDDFWVMVPMTGQAAEAIERLAGGVDGVPTGRIHWLIGSLAAQMRRADSSGQVIESEPPADDSGFEVWVKDRMTVFAEYPETDFVQMLTLRERGRRALHHLFDVDVSDDGLVVLPKEGGEGDGLPPARFPVDRCLSEITRGLAQSLQGADS